MGRKKNFDNMFKEVASVLKKHGATLVGFWWTLGGEGNEAIWITSWKNLDAYDKAKALVDSIQEKIEQYDETIAAREKLVEGWN